MAIFENIQKLAKTRGKSIQTVALEIGFSENLFYGWKNRQPKADDLAKVADYFHVSVDYLLGREEIETIKDPVDIADLISDDDVDWDKWISFDGKPICDEDKQILKRIFGNQLKD